MPGSGGESWHAAVQLYGNGDAAPCVCHSTSANFVEVILSGKRAVLVHCMRSAMRQTMWAMPGQLFLVQRKSLHGVQQQGRRV